MVGIGSERGGSNAGGGGGGVSVNNRLPRTQMKPRLQAKPLPTLQNMTVTQRKTIGITDLNRRITDLKVEGGVTTNPQTKGQMMDVQQRLQPIGTNQTQIRRDSNSTVSSYYGSMRSADMSRKSSLASQVRKQLLSKHISHLINCFFFSYFTGFEYASRNGS